MKCVVFVLALTACDAGTTHVSPVKAAPPVAADAAVVDVPVVVADARVAVVEPENWLEPYFIEPRISGDGKHVLFAVIDDDGARSAQNLALEIHDRRDRVEGRVVLLAIDEEPDAATRASRQDAANRLMASHDWTALPPLLRDDAPDPDTFVNAELAVTWKAERMRVRAMQAGKRVVDRSVPVAWRGGSYFNKAEDLTCDNPDYLSDAYGSLASKLIVVDVAYRGNDTCWESTSALHVVSW